MTHSSVKLGDTAFSSTYHFIAGGHGTGSLTNLVSSITQTGGNCGYGYDDNGNITSATVNGKWAGYAYDELGQLVRVNDRSDIRAGEDGSTWVYEYDQGGNILSKKLYPYADTSSEPLQTVSFTYGNANWKDQLTAVNGVAITYDAIGTPLNDGIWTYTWQNGRQLAGMSKNGMTVSFKYNAAGLRTRKIVNGVVTNYTLHGKNVVHMTQGSNNLHFFYDAQNKPAVVVYNGTAYAYVKNLQGDIIAILDSAGTAVVSYTYDAWGAPIVTTGTMAATLGVLNPFRYRGYVYDEETEVYYLRSRYYNPIWSRFFNADDELIRNDKGFCFHLFAYCSNNSVARIDCDGKEDKVVYEADDGNVTNDLAGAPGGGPINYTNTVSNSGGGGGKHPGRHGGPQHQGCIATLKGLLKQMYPGKTIKTEAHVISSSGNSRYGDIGVYASSDAPMPFFVVQVGRSLMSGNPIARERHAIRDITSSGVYVMYWAYDKNGPAMFYHP